MNYIPGFSNYLETSVPRYARGGPARFAEEDVYEGEMIAPLVEQQYLPAVQPMTQEAVAPYDMGGLGGLDFGNFYGGYDMGQYTPPAQPIMQQPAAAPYVAPYQPLPSAQPMTQEVAAPYDLSGLAGLDLSGLNFGSNFGGGAMGGQYQADPNLQYIAAPLSNKGNPTSQTGGNTFAVKADQPVRLVDNRTNQVVFEGSGFDAARKATELGQGLTDALGRKANYSIQTADPTGNYSTVAYEKKNKSTLGTIANVVGTALPLAAMAIPGLQGLAAIGVGAGLGGAGAALKGDNILKGAALGGLSAAGGQLLGGPLSKIGASNIGLRAGTAIGTGIGSTAGGLATGQSLKNSLLGGVASGALSYMSPDITKGLKGLGIGPSSTPTTSTSGSAPSGPDIVVSATPAVTPISLNTSLGGSQNKIQQALAQGSEAPFDGITAVGNRLGGLSAVNFGGNQFGAPGQDKSAFERLTDPNEILVRATPATQPSSVSLSPDVLAGIAEFEKNPIISEGSKIERPTSVSPDVLAGMAEFEKNPIVAEGSKIERPTSTLPPLDLGLIDRLSGMENYAEKPIDVVGSKIVRSTPVGVSVVPPLDPLPPLDLKSDPTLTDKKKIGLEEYLRLAGLATGVIGGAAGAGARRTGTYASGGGRLQNVFSARLPSASGIFSSKNLAPRDMSGTDFLRYGYGPEKSFFHNVPTNAGERDRLVNEFRPSSLPLSAMYDPEALRQDALRQLAIGAPIEAVLDALLLNATPQEIEFYTKTPKGQQELVRLLGGSPNSGTSNPSMYVPDDMRFAEGGAFAAKRGGASKRTEFAVNGAGTGRSDEIPAVLSDGEYVIDAETVALLGDGSSKAGAKKLDDLRVKVRKHKGEKLAKGRFSANAKNPEAYLSGGRI